MPSPSLVLVELVAKLRDPEVSTHDLAALLRRDATLAYQILRLANSPLNGVRRQVRSIEDALVVLGADAVRNWAAILVLARLSSKRPAVLLELAITRGAMCARTGELLGLRDPDTLYTIGLLSVLDGLLNRPMQGILAGLSLAEPVRDALLGGSGPLGDVLRLVIDFERGQWHALTDDMTELMMSSLSDAYESALCDSRAMLAVSE
jgi:EAL and modified HD-GYP domain-containing signal transduction protein